MAIRGIRSSGCAPDLLHLERVNQLYSDDSPSKYSIQYSLYPDCLLVVDRSADRAWALAGCFGLLVVAWLPPTTTTKDWIVQGSSIGVFIVSQRYS